MAAEFILTPETHQDLARAYAWYEERRTGLGEDFLSAVDACFARIQRQPDFYPIAYETFRRATLRRFPYNVIFEATREAITVYAVLHSARDPDKWRERLP